MAQPAARIINFENIGDPRDNQVARTRWENLAQRPSKWSLPRRYFKFQFKIL